MGHALLVVGGIALMVAATVGAVRARLRLWTFRTGPPTPRPDPPSGSIALAARLERPAGKLVTAVLAHLQAIDALEVHRTGEDRPRGLSPTRSSGPVWRFVVGPGVAHVDPFDRHVLAALVPGALEPGAEFVLAREDRKSRERIAEAIIAAARAQAAAFGPREPYGRGVSWGLRGAVVLGSASALVGAVARDGPPVVLASVILLGLVCVGVVIALCARPSLPSAGERAYRQHVVDLGEWVRTTDEHDSALAGWAMLWFLPGRWAAVAPPGISGLRLHDGDFQQYDPMAFTPSP